MKLRSVLCFIITCGFLQSFAMVDRIIDDQRSMPIPLRNRHGICYANTIIQCLLHIPGFVDVLNKFCKKDTSCKELQLCWQRLSQIYNTDTNVRDSKTHLIKANTKPLVKLVHRLNPKVFFDGDTFTFFRVLWGQLFQEAGWPSHRFYYCGLTTTEQHGLYPLFSFVNNFESFTYGDVYRSTNTDSMVPVDGIIDVVPECKLIVFRVIKQHFLPRDLFVTVMEGIKKILSESWRLVTNKVPDAIILKSFPMTLIAKNTKKRDEGLDKDFYYGHVIGYVCHNDTWFMCSDATIQRMGQIDDVVNHMYSSTLGAKISQLNPFGMPDDSVLEPLENLMLFYAVT